MPRPPSFRLAASRAALVLGALGGVATAACAGVLGIEDATCDPEFAPECRGPVAALGGGGGAPLTPVASAGTAGSGATELVSSGGAGGSSMPPLVEEEPEETLCEEYCRVVAESCVGGDEQYASEAACRSVCAVLDAGEPGDTGGNTVQCRLNRAELAASTGEPGNYCFSAGPGGAGVCGDDCEGFCAVMTAKCSQMGDFEQCLSACDDVPDLSGAPTNVTYDTSQQSGDSLQCRLFHVSAASLDPIGHCVHAAGLAVCSPPSTPL